MGGMGGGERRKGGWHAGEGGGLSRDEERRGSREVRVGNLFWLSGGGGRDYAGAVATLGMGKRRCSAVCCAANSYRGCTLQEAIHLLSYNLSSPVRNFPPSLKLPPLKFLSPCLHDDLITRYMINVKQIAKFVVGLGDKVAPTDIEEGMRVGVDRAK